MQFSILYFVVKRVKLLSVYICVRLIRWLMLTIYLVVYWFIKRDNYSKPTWGLARLRFAYPWFKTLHFVHLRLPLLGLCYPPLLKRTLNMYFCAIFMSLSSLNVKHTKIQEKTRSKCAIGEKNYAIS